MKKLILLFLPILPVYSLSQGLLVNGGFEEENICTEYKIDCAPEAWISSENGFENYFTDAGRAYEGLHCMAIEAGHTTRPFERTFIRSQLLCKLRKGEQYRLEFFVKSLHAVLDSVGVYFGWREPMLERKPIHLLAPSLFLADQSNHFANDSSWQKAVLDYTAAGGETYITIANFSRNDVNGKTGIPRRNQFLLFIDNISLVPLNPEERLCANWKEVKKEIYEQDERHQYLLRALTYRTKDTLLPTELPTGRVLHTDTLVLPDVLFATGKKELQPASFALLDGFCSRMAGKHIDSLVIEGHTDKTGTMEYNEQLAAGRAGETAVYFRRCASFPPAKTITRGWGSRRPVAANDTPGNRQRNRRVELRVYFRE